MDLLTGKIRPIYFKYLSAAFGSAMITSVYSIVDMAMVGQYQGPDGTAALAVVAPIWNIIVKAKLFCPEIAGLFCRIAGLFCHDSRANLSLKPVCFGIAIS